MNKLRINVNLCKDERHDISPLVAELYNRPATLRNETTERSTEKRLLEVRRLYRPKFSSIQTLLFLVLLCSQLTAAVFAAVFEATWTSGGSSWTGSWTSLFPRNFRCVLGSYGGQIQKT